MSKEDIEIQTFGFNIWQFFSSCCYDSFTDGPEGFYTVYRNVFEKLKSEEEDAFNYKQENDSDDDDDEDKEVVREFVKPPGFGDSKTSIDAVLEFYNFWSNFSTYKSFSWADTYDAREAPNRYVRRQIDKENLKERKKERKNYITTIKKLIEFCKRRDPRYKAYEEEVEKQE